MLRVNFCDNDFSSVVFKACENFIRSLTNGHEKYDAKEQLAKSIKEYGIEKIRKAIVLASYGYYIVSMAENLNSDYSLEDTDTIKDYLDANITVQEVTEFRITEGNISTCYLDLFLSAVYLV